MRKLIAAIAALAVFVGASINLDYGDLRYSIANRTLRGWKIVDSVQIWKPACALGGVPAGGWPCSGATTYTMTGPSSGVLGNNAGTITVTPVGSLTSSVTVTFSDSSHGGIFTPASVTMTGAGAQTATYTPLQIFTGSISATNSDSLTNPSPVSFATNASVTTGYPGMTTWASNNGSTLTNGLAGDPFGGSNNSSETEDTSTGLHSFGSPSMTLTANQAYTISIMAKQGTGTRNLEITLTENVGFTAALGELFNVSTCTPIQDTSFGGAVNNGATASTTGLATGWCLLQIKGTLGNFTSAFVQGFMNSGTNGSYTGDGSSTIDVYGPAVE